MITMHLLMKCSYFFATIIMVVAFEDMVKGDIDYSMCPKADECSFEMKNFTFHQKGFKLLLKEVKPTAVIFKIKGIDWSQLKDTGDTYDVFDDNLWVWANKGGKFLLTMPYDNRILSFGLLTIGLSYRDVNFDIKPEGCLNGLPNKCAYKMVTEVLFNLTESHVPGPDDHHKDPSDICRSSFVSESYLTNEIVGAGFDCCTRYVPFSSACKPNVESRRVINIILFVTGIILPIIILFLMTHILDISLATATDKATQHVAERLTRAYRFILKKPVGKPDADFKFHDNYIIILKKHLVAYSDEVNVLPYTESPHYVDPFLIKWTIITLIQSALLTTWLIWYGTYNEQIRMLNSSEKIIFNLRNNPLAWVYTSSEFWPFYIGVGLLVMSFLNVLMTALWWFFECCNSFNKIIFDKFIRSVKVQKPGRTASRKTNPKYKRLQMMLRCSLMFMTLCCYVTLYATFHSMIFTLTGIILNIKTVSSALIGVVLFFFYLQGFLSEIWTTYTDIKREAFSNMLGFAQKYKAHRCKENGKFLVMEHEEKTDKSCEMIMNRYANPITYDWEVCDAPILFYAHEIKKINIEENEEEESEDQQVLKPEPMCGYKPRRIFMHRKLLEVINESVDPPYRHIRKCVLKLLCCLCFLGLIIMTLFLINVEGQGGGILMPALISLMAALIPKLTAITKNSAAAKLAGDMLRYRVYQLVRYSRPYIMDIKKLDEFEKKITPKTHYGVKSKSKPKHFSRIQNKVLFDKTEEYEKCKNEREEMEIQATGDDTDGRVETEIHPTDQPKDHTAVTIRHSNEPKNHDDVEMTEKQREKAPLVKRGTVEL